MRLWSISPKYLDSKGLVAVWREGLLAKAVLIGETKGYKNHPQLNRLKNKPIASIQNYLYFIWEEANKRGYKFDVKKIGLEHEDWVVDCPNDDVFIDVTKGQLKYELNHLLRKLHTRDIEQFCKVCDLVGGQIDYEYYEPKNIEPNPLFTVIEGDIEKWEKIK